MSRFTRSAVLGFVPLGAAMMAAAPAPLYSNGNAAPTNPGLSTGTTAGNGASAPAGASWSELPSDGTGANALAGASCHLAGGLTTYRAADDFTVGGYAYGWKITSLTLFAHFSAAGSPQISSLHIRFWSGPPGSPGSVVEWDSNGLSVPLALAPLNVFRIFNSVATPLVVPDTTRPIWQVVADIPDMSLPPGVHWIDWQFRLVDPAGSAYAPTVTSTGARGRAGANARQFKAVGGSAVWTGLFDTGKPAAAADVAQELPFILVGLFAPPPCLGNANGDRAVNFADVTTILTNWGMSYLPGTGAGDADGSGVVDFADVTATLQSWNTACP
jgi:hypothetical protein